jgi:4,5-DOPA dioxygenase extradiol
MAEEATTPSSARSEPRASMRAAFLGHGSPMNAIEHNRYTEAWRAFGAEGPRPRAIVVVSAHWYEGFTALTAMAQPRTIHDFYGFPQPLFDVRYAAPGDPALAAEVAELLEPTHSLLDRDAWGLDHGAWSVLVHAFPARDVPVIQLSIHARQPFDYHFALGRKLAPLRERGVLVLASGNVVHNLRAIDWKQPEAGFDWAQRFDEAARTIMRERPADVLELTQHPDYARAVPSPDHFLPLVYFAGLAAEAGRGAELAIDGYAFGSLSMTSYTL